MGDEVDVVEGVHEFFENDVENVSNSDSTLPRCRMLQKSMQLAKAVKQLS